MAARGADGRCSSASEGLGRLDFAVHSTPPQRSAAGPRRGRVARWFSPPWTCRAGPSCAWGSSPSADEEGRTLFTMTYYGSLVVKNLSWAGKAAGARCAMAAGSMKGIRVHAISPGPLATRGVRHSGIDALLDKAKSAPAWSRQHRHVGAATAWRMTRPASSPAGRSTSTAATTSWTSAPNRRREPCG